MDVTLVTHNEQQRGTDGLAATRTANDVYELRDRHRQRRAAHDAGRGPEEHIEGLGARLVTKIVMESWRIPGAEKRRSDVKIRHVNLTVALIVICALNAGCATGRRTIALDVPVSTVATTEKGAISIAKVTDERHFENKPAQASTPSIDGDVNKVSRETLKTMIGRQRGGFGAALGDVALTPPATVETQVQALITEGLKRRGYTVGASSRGDSVDVTIKEFWAWFRPGFAQIAFEAQIRTLVSMTVNGQKRTLDVNGHGREEGQIASDEHWQRAYALAYEDYLKNLDSSLADAGL